MLEVFPIFPPQFSGVICYLKIGQSSPLNHPVVLPFLGILLDNFTFFLFGNQFQIKKKILQQPILVNCYYLRILSISSSFSNLCLVCFCGYFTFITYIVYLLFLNRLANGLLNLLVVFEIYHTFLFPNLFLLYMFSDFLSCLNEFFFIENIQCYEIFSGHHSMPQVLISCVLS